jgi:hypothetical protein
MKRLFRIFDLSKSEQRVVLIVMLVLISIGFVQYERRLNRADVRARAIPEAKTSPTPLQTEGQK